MFLRTISWVCLLWALSSAAPQRKPYNQNDNSNGQYDKSNGQYDNSNGQYDNSNGQYNNGVQQYDDSGRAYITKYDLDNDGTGNYFYNVSQSDGIYVDQVGQFQAQETDENGDLRVYGHYAYPAPDGQLYYVEYVADNEGFRPAGKHIPKAASVGEVGQLGIPSAAIASLAGGGLG